MIFENINKGLQNELQQKQWNNTTAVISWFKKIENKNKYEFMIFDIEDLYSLLKVVSAKFLLMFCISKREHLRNKEKCFYFTSKARFVLQITKF